jgi:hypothetical protein
MVRRALWYGLFTITAASCAGPTRLPDGYKLKPDEVTLEVLALTTEGVSPPRSLRPEDEVVTGQNLRIHVKTGSPAYVWIVYRPRSGWGEIYFGNDYAGVTTEAWVPTASGAVRLASEPQAADIVVLLSPGPLTDEDRKLLRINWPRDPSLIRRDQPEQPPPSTPPPEPVPEGQRDGDRPVVVKQGESYILMSSRSSDKSATLVFKLNHRR